MNSLLAVFIASKRLVEAIKSGKNPDELTIKNLIEAVDNIKFDETVVDTSISERIIDTSTEGELNEIH